MLIFNNKEKILIFGAGSGAINFYKSNKKHYNIIGFLDNNTQMQGKLLFQKKICSPKRLCNIDYDRIIIASDYYREIYVQLIEELGISEKKITIFHFNDSVDLSIWKKFTDAITNYKYDLLCNRKIWLFNVLYRLFTRKSELQLKDIVWLDEMEEYKVEIFRQSKRGNVHGPNFLEKKTTVKSVIIPEVALYQLWQGQICSTNRSVIMHDGRVVIERVVTAPLDNSDYAGGHLVTHGKNRALVRVLPAKSIDKGIAIIGASETNYYHWMIEILSQLQYVDELPEKYKHYPLLISKYSQKISSIKEMLFFFDIRRPVIFLDSMESYLINDMLLINSPNFQVPNLKQNAWGSVENVYFREESILYLRQLVLNNINIKTSLSKRIFLARKGILRSYNQKEVSHLLHRYGFVEVYLENLCFSEQVSIIQNAEVVIGPSGAAWTNLIFCKSGTKALSWMAEEFGEPSCFSCLAHFINIKMDYLTYKAGTDNTRELYYKSYTIDINAIQYWLESNQISVITR